MVVLSVCEDFADVQLLPVVVNDGDDAKVISSNVKYRIRVHVVRRIERLFDFRQILETRFTHQLVPRQHGFSRSRVFKPKVGQGFFGDHVHGHIIAFCDSVAH